MTTPTRALTTEEDDLYCEFFGYELEGADLAEQALPLIEAGKSPFISEWMALAPSTREALTEWLNIQDPDVEDLKRLYKLWSDGNFRAWTCPNCDEQIYVGDPDDWGNFQGVCQSEHLGELCAACGALYQKLKEWADA